MEDEPGIEMNGDPAIAKTKGEQTRLRLLEAAIVEFGRYGFVGASTRRIADAAQVNYGLIKYYFDNKDRLWHEAVRHLFATSGGYFYLVFQRLRGLPDLDRGREVVRELVRFFAAHPEMHRFMVTSSQLDREKFEWIARTYTRPQYQVLSTLLSDAMAKGLTTPGPLLSAFYALVGAGNFIFVQAGDALAATGTDPRSPATIEAHADYLANLFFPLPAADSEGRPAGEA